MHNSSEAASAPCQLISAGSESRIGCRFWVRWRDGSTHVAEILESRKRRHKRQKLETSTGETSQVEEYYVHYVDFDRRLDEWVSSERVLVDTGPLPKDTKEKELVGQKQKRRRHRSNATESAGAASLALEKEHEELTKVKNVNRIELGEYEIDTWYYSPFPEEYSGEKLYVCEFCLKYMRHRRTLRTHMENCSLRSPPGREIYRRTDETGITNTVYEVDGSEHKVYCQNLCLLSKLFLDHKTLYYDVDPFLFYILCRADDEGSHIVGYFSKEKDSSEGYNLACILVFPPFQRCGYGKFIISLSYELSKIEGKVGSPEKPLSDLGKISYRSYWAYVLLKMLKNSREMSVNEVSKASAIRIEDIISTLQSLNLIRSWKGQHVVCLSQNVIDQYFEEYKSKSLCDPSSIAWTPPDLKSVKKGTVQQPTLNS